MYKLIFFVPPSHVETVKAAIFDTDAGHIGRYSHCCWQVLGQGQFMPLAGSDPHIGQSGHIEILEEFRVELVCDDSAIILAVEALKAAHPYEEPAYEVYRLADY